MRPDSMVLFDRLFFGAMLLGVVGGVINWQMTMALLAANPALGVLGPKGVYAMVIGSMVFGLAISLLFWYFISRRGSNLARWIWVVLVVIGIPGALSSAFGHGTMHLPGFGRAIIVINLLLHIATIAMLFRADSRAWFARKDKAVDTGVFN